MKTYSKIWVFIIRIGIDKIEIIARSIMYGGCSSVVEQRVVVPWVVGSIPIIRPII